MQSLHLKEREIGMALLLGEAVESKTQRYFICMNIYRSHVATPEYVSDLCSVQNIVEQAGTPNQLIVSSLY